MPQAIEGVFQSLDSALANKTIAVGASPLPPVNITLNGQTNQLDIMPLDWMQVDLQLGITTDTSQAAHPTSRGVALIDTSTADPLFESPRSQLGIQLLVVNGLLHELWDSGLLEVPSSDTIPLTISGKLPPIVRLPREGETDDLVISLGELEVVPNGDETKGRLGVLIEAGLDLNLANNALSVTLSDTPSVTVWTIEPPQSGVTLFTPQFLTTLIQGTLWPKLQSGNPGRALNPAPHPPARLHRERGPEPRRPHAHDRPEPQARLPERLPGPRRRHRSHAALSAISSEKRQSGSGRSRRTSRSPGSSPTPWSRPPSSARAPRSSSRAPCARWRSSSTPPR